MFTGIVEELGDVVAIEQDQTVDGATARLTVRGPRVVSDVRHGDSIAVNGCCMTVTSHDATTFVVDVMAETLDKTSIGRLRAGSPVNLERALPADGRLGGHIVQGHVDGTGRIIERRPSRPQSGQPQSGQPQSGQQWETVRVELPPGLSRYVATKGSITVDGVSLTVVSVDDESSSFTVSLIPTTLAETTLGAAPVGSVVNLEVDVIAKYVERLQLAGADR